MQQETDCKKGTEYKLCSECAQEGHVWHQCKELIKTCVNCNENHSTMAMRCMKKKEIIRQERLEESRKKNFSYAGVVKCNTSQHTFPPQQANANYSSLKLSSIPQFTLLSFPTLASKSGCHRSVEVVLYRNEHSTANV